MDLHREMAERVGAELAGRSDVLAVTTEDSLLEVGPRRLVDGLLMEWIARPEAQWLARFDRPKTSWLYSFLEAEILMDSGPAGRLVQADALIEAMLTGGPGRFEATRLLIAQLRSELAPADHEVPVRVR